MASKGKCCGFFGWLLWTSLVFSGGYVAGDFGPPAQEVLANVGVHIHGHERSADIQVAPNPYDAGPMRGMPSIGESSLDGQSLGGPRSHEDEVREVYGRVGEYVGLLNTRIETQQASLKESETSAKIMLSQGTEEESSTIQALRREQDRIDGTLVELGDSLDEALALEGELRRVLDAAAEVDASYVAGSESLEETKALLTRLDLMGLGTGLDQ